MALDNLLFEKLYELFPHGLFFNWFFLIFTFLGDPKFIWFLFVIGFFLFRHKKIGWIFLEVALAMGIAVILNEFILKNIFLRPRPFETLLNISSLDPWATGFSFPSSHAIVAFSLATVIAIGFKKKITYLLFLIYALMVSYSRIYLGVHFPLDVVAGAFIGIISGWLVANFLPSFYKILFNKHEPNK